MLDVDVQIFFDEFTQFSVERLVKLLEEIEILKTVELRYSVKISKRVREGENFDPTIRARRIRIIDRKGEFRYEIGDYLIHRGEFYVAVEDGFMFDRQGKLEENPDFVGARLAYESPEFPKPRPSLKDLLDRP